MSYDDDDRDDDVDNDVDNDCDYNYNDGIEYNNVNDGDDAYLYLGPNISKSFTICRCSLITAATNRR
jgi:hypothetical protein